MNRDSRGRFARKNEDNVLINKMNLNINNNSREIPVEDNRKKITIPIVNFNNKPDKNGCVYNIDKELINRAIKSINKLGLGSIEHPVKIDSFFDMFTCECANEKAKKTDGELTSTLSKNMIDNLPKAELKQKITYPSLANKRVISWYGNKVGNDFNTVIVTNLEDFITSFNNTIMVSMSIDANNFPNIISFLEELKKYDYFTVVFNSYNAQGCQVENKTFDGFKLFDLTYVGKTGIYSIRLTKNNI